MSKAYKENFSKIYVPNLNQNILFEDKVLLAPILNNEDQKNTQNQKKEISLNDEMKKNKETSSDKINNNLNLESDFNIPEFKIEPKEIKPANKKNTDQKTPQQIQVQPVKNSQKNSISSLSVKNELMELEKKNLDNLTNEPNQLEKLQQDLKLKTENNTNIESFKVADKSSNQTLTQKKQKNDKLNLEIQKTKEKTEPVKIDQEISKKSKKNLEKVNLDSKKQVKKIINNDYKSEENELICNNDCEDTYYDVSNIRSSEYENLIFEYNQDLSSSEGYNMTNDIPEFLIKKNPNDFRNNHLNKLYFKQDYIDGFFKAIDEQNLSALERFFAYMQTEYITNNSGENALIYSVKHRKNKVVRYLLKRGFHTRLKNNYFQNALDVALRYNNFEAYSLMKNY